MKIDYSKIIPFKQTLVYLDKHYSKAVLEKFAPQLILLYQNGYTLNANGMTEVDEALNLFNYFENWEDFEAAKYESSVSPDIGDKIIAEEIYEILTKTKWVVNGVDTLPKQKFDFHKNEIYEINRALGELFFGDYMTLKESVKKFSALNVGLWEKFEKAYQRFDDLCSEMPKITIHNDKIFEEYYNSSAEEILKIFEELRSVLFRVNTIYQKAISKKVDNMSSKVADNINFELYGSSGGFNPNTKKIKANTGSAVDELRVLNLLDLKNPVALRKFKTFIKTIMDDNEITAKNFSKIKFDSKQDKEDFQYLINYMAGQVPNAEKAREIVNSIKLAGIMNLLMFKHQTWANTSNEKLERFENEYENIKMFAAA